MSLTTPSLRIVEEVLHGVQVRDPYRWLEDRSLPETKQWIEEQRARYEAYFLDCDALGVLRRRVESFLNVEVVDQPVRVGEHYFYRRRNRDQEQACIYVKTSCTGKEQLLVDPSNQGPFTSVGIHRISDDASLLAYEVKLGGGDTSEIRIVDVKRGQILPDSTGMGYARGFAFASGNDGFYYCQESFASHRDHVILSHSFSRSVKGRAIFARPRLPGSRLVLIADSVHLGAIWIREHGSEPICDFFIAPLDRNSDWRPIFVNKKLQYSPILHLGRVFVLSYENVPSGQIVEFALDGGGTYTVIRNCEMPPQQIVIAGSRFFVSYRKNGNPLIRSWTLEGEETRSVDFPTNGTVRILSQLATPGASLFYSYESFIRPPQIFEYATDIEKSVPLGSHGGALEQGCVEVRTNSLAGKDGTAIPITLVARNGFTHSAVAPVIMTSYGGFGVSITPTFSVLATIMMQLGAVFVLPHIRGGGEFGKPWHDAGSGRNRQTAIDDFISAAEWLCAEGITVPSRLAIFGGSNSGLLVGAALTQRPGLFRAVLCIAPLLDMVRYERFDQAAKWRPEYGTVESAEEFHALYAYSPYHHVRMNVDYPATLFVCGDKDDRCNPAHVRKMAARLQERAAQCNPILVDYTAERGHSPVLPLSVRVEALALRLAFLCRELCIEVPREVCYDAADN